MERIFDNPLPNLGKHENNFYVTVRLTAVAPVSNMLAAAAVTVAIVIDASLRPPRTLTTSAR